MKNLITLIILAIFLFIDCQAQPRWYGDEVFYPHMTSLGSTSWIQVNDNGQTKVISGPALASYLGAGSTLLAGNNPWAGSNSFSLPVQMAGEYDLTKDYAVSFHNSKYGYTLNGAWNQFVLASEIASYLGDAGDASTFVTKAGNDTITGWKRFNNTLYIYGSTEYQAGSQVNFPYWSSVASLPSYRVAYTIRGGRAVPMWNDGVNPPSRLVDSTYLVAQGQGAFIPSTGTKTGISVNASMSSGKWTFGTSSQLVLTPQNQGSSPTWVDGRIYVKAGTEAKRLYMNYQDQDYNHLTTYAPDIDEVETLMANILSANAVSYETQTSYDTVDFANKNTIHSYLEDDGGGVTLYKKNYQASISQQVVVYGQSAPIINFGTTTLLYESGVPIQNLGTGYYRIWFTYLTSTKCLVDWGFYETL